MIIASPALPELRQDLRIERGVPMASGAPGWVIHDPVRHRYFQVGRGVLEMLSEWSAGSVDGVRRAVAARHGRTVTEEEIAALAGFLTGHELAMAPSEGGATLAERELSRHHHWVAWLVHNYLFFRVPLLRPQRVLDATRWIGLVVFSTPVLAAMAVLGLLAVTLLVRRWDSFAATALSFLSIEGAAAYAVTLACVKSIHELGHAYMATRYRVKVPVMGVAFMVMAPFLYSEVSDAWRLPSRLQKLAIDGAGMLAELMLAVLALLAWVFLPDGLGRSAAFLVATGSIVTSLFLNMNPFMRFDGYHILADALAVPNLQTRAMAVGRWQMREILFGLGAPPPEAFSRRGLVAAALYAYAIWIYRLLLFLGIALLVYHMAFKVLGIVLFLIEIVWFVLRPIGMELRVLWIGRRILLRRPRAWVTLAVLATGLAALVIPWSTTIVLPALSGAKADARIFPPSPGKVVELKVREGSRVAAGDVLLVLSSPDLLYDLARTRHRIALLQTRLDRSPADQADRAEIAVLAAQLDSERRAEAGLVRQVGELVVRAPVSGIVRDLDPDLQTGLWAAPRQLLMAIVGPGQGEVRGYVREDDLRRVEPGAVGRFVPEDPQLAAVRVRLAEIARTGADTLDWAELAAPNDGPIQVVEDQHRGLVPREAVYVAVLDPVDTAAPPRSTRGQVRLQGRPESMAERMFRQVVAVLIRESGA